MRELHPTPGPCPVLQLREKGGETYMVETLTLRVSVATNPLPLYVADWVKGRHGRGRAFLP